MCLSFNIYIIMRIYVRHAEKEYVNGDAEQFKHDPSIIEQSYSKCQSKANDLIYRYGIPFAIVCSPYKRTRETALKMREEILNKHNINVPIKIDIKLSEFLGNHRNDKLDVDDMTFKFNPPHPENFHQMDSRVRWHNDIFKSLDDSSEVIWYVTHGFIINRVGNAMGFKLPHRISYLSSVAFRPNAPRHHCELNDGSSGYWSLIYRET